MEPIRVFLLDTSRDFLVLLREALGREPDLLVEDVSRDGLTAYEKLSAQRPDVLVTELVLPGLDGLGLLRRLKSEDMMPPAIVLSGFYTDRMSQALSRLGVAAFLPKPCSVTELTQRIREAAEGRVRLSGTDLLIRDALLDFGIPAHLSGYRYLHSAVRRTMEDRSVLRGITKILYPDIAREFSTTGHCVERSIRSVVSRGWETGSPERRRNRFGTLFDSLDSAPSNARFIATMAEYLQIGYARTEFRDRSAGF
ncbi:MAG: response regulator [Oscillospiraceae bacterium]|nr:response regulator [Oscillospiraceae bacterium]MBQ2633797.1 response regulator [Oscillospiraceae bacterium]MBR3083323.1 response regulator [Oscillospiraceae bacterium]